MWKRTFGVGPIAVRLESEHPQCAKELGAITSLFADSDKEPTLTFSICHSDDISLTLNHEELWRGDDPGEITAAFEVHLYVSIVHKLLPELTSIHAACVGMNNKAYIFAGVSNAGKSSMCTKAVLEGCQYLSDEFSLLNMSGEIEPFPRPLQWGKMKHPAFTDAMMKKGGIKQASFTFPDRDGNSVTALLWLPPHVQHKPLPLRHVIFPRYDDSIEAPELTTIRRGEALMELPQHLHQQQRADIMLQLLNQRIPKKATFHRIRFNDVHEAWELLKRSLFA